MTAAASSLMASGVGALNINSPLAQTAISSLTGGVTSVIGGGSFIEGAARGLVVGLLNHAMHGGNKYKKKIDAYRAFSGEWGPENAVGVAGASFSVEGGVIIEYNSNTNKWEAKITATVSTINVISDPRSFFGKASIEINGNIVESKMLKVRKGDYIIPEKINMKFVPIGEASFTLPSSGTIHLILEVGTPDFDTG